MWQDSNRLSEITSNESSHGYGKMGLKAKFLHTVIFEIHKFFIIRILMNFSFLKVNIYHLRERKGGKE